jgi:beta-lactamase class A
MARPEGVHDRIATVAEKLGGTVGVAARNLASQAGVFVNADVCFPMASCFKVPVMVEVMRQVDAGSLRLDDRLTLCETDKSPGSTLIHCREGLRPSVRDLLYLMITLSDNTATDMLWRLVGLGAVSETMRSLGLESIDCFMPNREYFLLESGAGEEWAGRSGPEIVARWRDLEARG